LKYLSKLPFKNIFNIALSNLLLIYISNVPFQLPLKLPLNYMFIITFNITFLIHLLKVPLILPITLSLVRGNKTKKRQTNNHENQTTEKQRKERK